MGPDHRLGIVRIGVGTGELVPAGGGEADPLDRLGPLRRSAVRWCCHSSSYPGPGLGAATAARSGSGGARSGSGSPSGSAWASGSDSMSVSDSTSGSNSTSGSDSAGDSAYESSRVVVIDSRRIVVGRRPMATDGDEHPGGGGGEQGDTADRGLAEGHGDDADAGDHQEHGQAA